MTGRNGPEWSTRSVAEDPVYTPEAADPELRNSYLVVPKLSTQSAGTKASKQTASSAVMQRAPVGEKVELIKPNKSANNVLQRIGLVDVEKVRVLGTPVVANLTQGNRRGLFARLDSIGMSAAYFPSESVRDAAFGELDDEYDFIPNFPLSMPARVTMSTVAATRGQSALAEREWPEASGVTLAHKAGIRGAQVLIGVVDTGIDADHAEFGHQTIPFRYVPMFPDDVPPRDIRGFDTEGHGSHVSGIIAGRNVGVAPEAELNVAAVIESETTRTSLIRVTYGLNWILRKFRTPENERKPAVLNLSLGFPSNLPAMGNDFAARLRVLRMLLRTLAEANVLPMVAIGNDGVNQYRYPGAFQEVMAVGAVDFEQNVADFSGNGSPDPGVDKPDVVGYGVGVYSSVERTFDGRPVYQRFNGTSMATPYAAGIAALYRCQYPTWPVEDIRKLMEDTAIELRGQPKSRVGAGIARFVPRGSTMMSRAIETAEPEPTPKPKIKPKPKPKPTRRSAGKR